MDHCLQKRGWKSSPMERTASTIGPAVVVEGDVRAAEDLAILGHVAGTVVAPDHRVMIGSEATVKADILAREILVRGAAAGRLTASERIEIGATASVEGALNCPRIAMRDGAHFKGTIDTRRSDAAARVARYRIERKIAGFS
jgi:cytoskeletal protein CcmA (bactofilin family)